MPTGAPPVGVLLVASAVHSDAVSAVGEADDPFVAKDTFWRRKPVAGAGAKTMATRGAMFLPNVMTVAVERRAFAAAVEISGGSCRPGADVVSTRMVTGGNCIMRDADGVGERVGDAPLAVREADAVGEPLAVALPVAPPVALRVPLPVALPAALPATVALRDALGVGVGDGEPLGVAVADPGATHVAFGVPLADTTHPPAQQNATPTKPSRTPFAVAACALKKPELAPGHVTTTLG